MGNKVLNIIKEVTLKIILGLLIIFGLVLIPTLLGGKSEETQTTIFITLFIMLAVSLVIYTLKQTGKLTSRYFKGVLKDIFDFIKAIGWFLLVIIGIILAGVIIYNFVGAIGTIPFLIIILIIVVGSRLEKIEAELRELRKRRGNKYNDYDEFK